MFFSRYHFKRGYKRLAAFFLDAAGGLLFFGLRRTAPLEIGRLQRVLFIRIDQIGDIALMMPALRAFREKFPQIRLDILTTPEGAALLQQENLPGTILVFENGWFRKTSFWKRWSEALRLTAKLRANHYDAAVDFRGDLRTIVLMALAGIPERVGYGMTGGKFLLTRTGRYWHDLHQVHLNMALLGFFGLESRAVLPEPFQISEDEKKNFWSGSGRGILLKSMPLIVVHTGAGQPEKIWEKHKYRRLVERMLKDRLGHVVLAGTEAERPAFGEIQPGHAHLTDLRGKTSLRELLVLLSAADIFVGGDSGPAHLAAAQGARVVVIFKGPNAPEIWHPWAKKLYGVRHPVPCPACGREKCPRRKQACLETIPARQVYEALLEAWHDTLVEYPLLPPVQPALEEF